MTRDTMIEALASYFKVDLDVDENDNYDLYSYDWESGCYCGGVWFSLKNVVRALEDYCEED